MGQIISLMLISVISFAIVHDLADELLKYNLSKRNYKSVMSRQSLKERVLLENYCPAVTRHKKMIKYCYSLNILLILFFSISLFVLPICIFNIVIRKYIVTALVLKALLLDCQVFIFAFLNTKPQKHGGIGWRF